MVVRASVEGCGNCAHWFDEGFDPDEASSDPKQAASPVQPSSLETETHQTPPGSGTKGIGGSNGAVSG